LSFDILVTGNESQRRIIILDQGKEDSNVLKNLILNYKFDFTPAVYIAVEVTEAINLAKQFHPDCIMAYGDAGREFFCELERLGIESARILICKNPGFDDIKDAINRSGVFRIIFKPWTEEEVSSAIKSAIEYIDITRSNSCLIAKAEARNRYLLQLKETLENKGNEQQVNINTSAFTVKGMNTDFEVMNAVLCSLQGIDSIEKVERNIKKVLSEHMGIKEIKIELEHRNNATGAGVASEGFLCLPLFCSGCFLGEMIFQKDGFFVSHEIDFLEKVSDVVAMSAEKIVRFFALEKIKKQWESSFDSIDDPIVIIDDRFNILRANRAFAETTQESLKDISGKKCYDVFQTDKKHIPCAGCNIRKAFESGQPAGSEITAQSGKRFYTTWSYPIKDSERIVSAVHFYKDVSDQVSYRERLVYSEKLAEIGILAGSVAHEINNPIGGIIALLQIIITETNELHPYYNDLKEMEIAAQRCKHIVDNLLHFSRSSRDEEVRDVEFNSIFKTLSPLIELQIRHENIKYIVESEGHGFFVKAVFNELVQSILNIINTSIELISKRQGSGFIKVSVKKDNTMLLLEITDNGIPLKNEGLGFGSLALFVTEKIVKGYRGMSYFEHVNGENRYRLYFPLSVSASSDISHPENAEIRS